MKDEHISFRHENDREWMKGKEVLRESLSDEEVVRDEQVTFDEDGVSESRSEEGYLEEVSDYDDGREESVELNRNQLS